MSDSLQKLANAIAAGAQTTKEAMQSAIHDCLAERFTKASLKGLRNGDAPFIRNAYSRGGDSSHVAYAGLVPPESAPSGAYGGASLVWFPSGEGSIISYVIGTLGLSPDEGILTKPGHKRRVASLRSYLAEQGAPSVWARQDPAALNNLMPDTEIEKLNAWQPVFGKYRSELYCIAKVPQDNPALARLIVRSFLDLYAKERHWQHFKDFDGEASELLAKLNDHWLAPIEQEEIENLLKERRFVVLQGPPGTGKSHVSEAIAKAYNGNSLFTQFHPSTTSWIQLVSATGGCLISS